MTIAPASDPTSALLLNPAPRLLPRPRAPLWLAAAALTAAGCPLEPQDSTGPDSGEPGTSDTSGDATSGGGSGGPGGNESGDQPTGSTATTADPSGDPTPGTTTGTTTEDDTTTGTASSGVVSTGDDTTTGGDTTTDTTTDGREPAPGCVARRFEVGPLTMLEFTIKDAEYSKPLDRIVAVGNEPSALHVYDPWTGDDAAVALPLAASSVSVGPGGMFAAVGHDGWVSYVDLVERTVIATHAVTADVLDVVLADNGYIYAFPVKDQWEQIYTIEVATGAQTQSQDWAIYAGTVAKLHPGGAFLYGANNGLSPSDIEKYDIQGGTASFLYDSPYHGDYAMCGDLWLSEDGKRIFTRCGNVFLTATDPAMDMIYNGSFAGEFGQIEHLSHSAAAGQVALIPTVWSWPGDPTVEDTEVRLFNYDFLTAADTKPLPEVAAKGTQFPMHGRYVFYDCLGENLLVIAQADPEASFLADYGVIHL